MKAADRDDGALTVTLELWRLKEAAYKIINRVFLFLGKGRYWYDCGYCRRGRGRLKCGAGPSPDEACLQERCRIFEKEGE
jgi:hypothetical protein